MTVWRIPFQTIKPLGDRLTRLLQGCARFSSFDNSSQVVLGGNPVFGLSAKLEYVGGLVKCIARFELEALKRDLLFVAQLALAKFLVKYIARFELEALKRDLLFVAQLALARVLLQRLTSSRQGRPGKEFRKTKLNRQLSLPSKLYP